MEEIKFNAGMLRQLFREMPKDRTFTAEELADLFEKLQPVFTPEQEEQIKKALTSRLKKKSR